MCKTLLGCVFCCFAFAIGCSDNGTPDETILDTDSSLDFTVNEIVDDRGIAQVCSAGADCDDRDPCTMDNCISGVCQYSRVSVPMQIDMLDVGIPLDSERQVVDVSVYSNRVYVLERGETNIVHLYDILEDGTTAFVTTVEVAAEAVAVDASNAGFVVAKENVGIDVFSRDGGESPVASVAAGEGVLSETDRVVNIALTSSYGFVAGYDEGVTVLTGELSSPSRLGTVDTIGRVVAIAPRGGFALLADSLGGASTMWIQDDVPQFGGTVSTEGRVVDVAVNHRTGLMAEYGVGFSLLDVSHVTAPKRLLSVQTDTPVIAVRLLGAQTGLIVEESGSMYRVNFVPFIRPTILEAVQLESAPMVRTMDFHNDRGVMALENGLVVLMKAGCS